MADSEGEQPQGPPTFVTRDGTPVSGPGAPPQPPVVPGVGGAPVFVNHDGTPAGAPAPPAGQPFGTIGQPPAAPPQGHPQFVAPQTYAPPAEAAPAGYHVAGGEPGGPVFVVADHGPGHEPLDESDRPWRWWVGPVAVTIAFVAVLFLGVFIAIIAEASGADATTAFDENTHWLGLAQDVIWIGVVLLVPFMAVRYLKPEQLGLQSRPFGRSLGVLLGVLVLFYVFAGLYAAAMGLDSDSNELLESTGIGETVSRDVLYALLFTVAAPVAEELLFRGLLFRSLRDAFTARMGNRGGIALGAIVSGVIFGGIHVGGGQDDFLPVLMALGVLLALAYQWSGTLYVPVIIHSINNAIATGANADPAADWIYGLIALGPVLSVLLLMGLTTFIRATFPQDPPERPAPPAPPVQGSPFFQSSGGPTNL